VPRLRMSGVIRLLPSTSSCCTWEQLYNAVCQAWCITCNFTTFRCVMNG